MARLTPRSERRVDRHLDEIGRLARPLRSSSDLDPLLNRIGDARIVQIGEASHGTSEYYRWRAELTMRLIEDRGFSFVAVEGDFPDCAVVDRWLRADASSDDARSVLTTFERWPTWMWANEEVAGFCRWLVEANRTAPHPAGFHGLDVYSLWESLREILVHLR
jgi:erythromycin esterase